MVIDFNNFYEMPKDMDRVFEMFHNSSMLHRRSTYPLINVYENDDSYIVDACMPGIAADDVELTLTAHSLVIKGERKSPEGRYFRQERAGGTFQRIINLNVPVSREKVSAKSVNGILRVTLPKTEEVKPRRISIE